MSHGIRTIFHFGVNKRFDSKLQRKSFEEDRSVQRLKGREYEDKDEDNYPNNVNNVKTR